MNSTNVPSNNNQTKYNPELTMMSIGVDRENLKGYEVVAGGNERVEVIDYIQKQLGPGLLLGNSALRKDGILRVENGSIPMKSKDAYHKVKANNEKRNKLQDKEATKVASVSERSNDKDR